MKSFIPKQPKHTRERVEAKIDSRLAQRLEQYCTYLESDRDYVLAQALELVLRKDKGFADWLASRGESLDRKPTVAGNR
jgi:bacterioferritin (cytochrome b1)